jgi:hypothetical protein
MAVVAGTPTVIINSFNVFEAIIPITTSGSYAAGGDVLNLIGIVPSNSVPVYVDIQEMPPVGTVASGLEFRFAVGTTQANGKMQAFQTGGSVAAPSFTVKNGTILANGTMGLDADAASAHVVGGTGITADRTLTATTPVGVPAFTGATAELGVVTYASVNVANLVARVMYKKFV